MEKLRTFALSAKNIVMLNIALLRIIRLMNSNAVDERNIYTDQLIFVFKYFKPRFR